MTGSRRDSAELAAARELVRQRERRRVILGAPVCSDAVWNLLLDLFIAHEEQAELSLTCIGLAGNVPATTALRWVRKLAEWGYLIRTADKSDGRRTIVRLTPDTIAKIRHVLKTHLSASDDYPSRWMPPTDFYQVDKSIGR